MFDPSFFQRICGVNYYSSKALKEGTLYCLLSRGKNEQGWGGREESEVSVVRLGEALHYNNKNNAKNRSL